MKTLTKLIMVTVLSAATAMAQETFDSVSKDTHLTVPDKPKKSPPARKEAPNEIRGKRFTFRGALIQIFKADNPLQLITP